MHFTVFIMFARITLAYSLAPKKIIRDPHNFVEILFQDQDQDDDFEVGTKL